MSDVIAHIKQQLQQLGYDASTQFDVVPMVKYIKAGERKSVLVLPATNSLYLIVQAYFPASITIESHNFLFYNPSGYELDTIWAFPLMSGQLYIEAQPLSHNDLKITILEVIPQ